MFVISFFFFFFFAQLSLIYKNCYVIMLLLRAKRIGTLRSNNGDAMKTSLKSRRLFQGAQLRKRKEFGLELKGRDRAQVQTEMVEFIALPFPFPSKLKIWSFQVLVMQGLQRNVQKSVMHVQSPYFADEAFCLFDGRVAVALAVSLGPQ